MDIHQQILQKISSPNAYFPDPLLIYSSNTDMNEFPYRRFFRGNYQKSYPIVYSRTAGYSPIVQTVKTSSPSSLVLGDGCFQYPCSTVLPCRKNSYSLTKDCIYTSP